MMMHVIAEGLMEEAAARRLLPFCGHTIGTVYGKQGFTFVRANAAKYYSLATNHSGVLVLTDFRDAGTVCCTAALQQYIWDSLPNPPKSFLCRFAVNELESWLLADRQGLPNFFGIAISAMPLQPEAEPFPKRTLVSLAHTARKSAIRHGIAPPPGHGGAFGREYPSFMSRFIADYWNIEAAMRHAPSLERCVRRLRELPQG